MNSNVATPRSRGRPAKKGFRGRKLNFTKVDTDRSKVNQDNFINKICILGPKCDIRDLKCGAIVNAANIKLLGGNGIDGKIHARAGPLLREKCENLPVKKTENGIDIRCYPGECEVTNTIGTNLTNCEYVFHTVGPDVRTEKDMIRNASRLKSCYENCLSNMLKYDVKSIAFCCISTGIYEYPNREAANIAFETVILWLEKNGKSVEKIIFCTWETNDFEIYSELLGRYIGKETENCNVLLDIDEQPSEHAINSKLTSDDTLSHSLIHANTTELREHVPVALKNSGENACFFNSVAQVLYSLLQFREHIFNTTLDNNVISQLKRLFREMQSSSIVHTYPIILDLHIPHHHDREQIDASEVVSFLLEHCFEKNIENDLITGQIREKPDYKLFRISEQTSIMCANCNKESFTSQTKLKGNCYIVVIEFFLIVSNGQTNNDY